MRTQEELKSLVKMLCADDIDYLVDYLPSLKKSKSSNHQIINRERTEIVCPFCKSIRCVKNGTTQYNRQKYYCKECKKSFSDTSNSIVFKSKYTYDQWIKFIDCELHNYSLVEESNKVGISESTAFLWRHKLYESIANVKKGIILSGKIEIDGKYYSINLKGTKPEKMPRMSKKRSSSAYRGISHHKICVLSAVDENDNMLFEIVGLGPESNEMMKEVEGKITNCTVLVSDGKFAYQTYCKEHKCINEMVKSGTYSNENKYNLATINGLHSELENDFKCRRGISTKHLQGYLDMFLFKKILRYTTDIGLRDIITYNKSVPSQTKKYIKDIFEQALPVDLYQAYGEYNFGILKK
jgi:transposase-like protein